MSAAIAYTMLGSETVWDAARAVSVALTEAGIPHALVGGVAVCLHGYERNTTDVDWVVRSVDSDAVRDTLIAAGFAWDGERREFHSPAGVAVQFVIAGAKAGTRTSVRLPDPSDERSVTRLEELPVLTLAKLIESKLACGQGSLRRTHRDYADVVELIAAHDLSRSFARHLHSSLRDTFRELVLHARGE